MKIISFIFILLFFYGCSDQEKHIIWYDKSHPSAQCLELKTKDIFLFSTLNQLYTFSPTCNTYLEASKKSAIVCNSNQNADKKALTNFPHGFLRLDIYNKDGKIILSYYRDVDNAITKEMVRDGFLAVKQALHLP